jgi:hypothetical protein
MSGFTPTNHRRRLHLFAQHTHANWARWVRAHPTTEVTYGKPDPLWDDKWAKFYADTARRSDHQLTRFPLS